ncbi:hypothetical protein GGR52DRAFT_159076 [Hypoxylon sp. FL1284]|nr:hypothetical protein GGR52DRAFT_159076 [Hypoxylon sp. FL1284]
MAVTEAPASTSEGEISNIEKRDNGLVLIHEFITEDEEAAMIEAFHSQDARQGGRRRISQHFGFHFDYTTFGASETSFTPVPKYMQDILPRLPVQEHLPDQFTTQYYPPGAGIPPHVDTHSMFEEPLYSLSFGSAVSMAFRKCDANDARRMRLPKRSLTTDPQAPSGVLVPPIVDEPGTGGGPKTADESWEILLPRRSLLLMTGAARYGYIHGIRARKTDRIDGQVVLRQDRYSLTMRKIRRADSIRCDCDFPGVCDARIREEEEQRMAEKGGVPAHLPGGIQVDS